MIYLSTIVFALMFIFITSLFRIIAPDKKILLNLIAFPFIILGYMFADLLAYELTHNYFAYSHSVALGTVSMLAEMFYINIYETWMLAIYLFVFTVIESYFFYSSYKIGEIIVPEVMEEITSGKTKKERYLLSIMLVIPMKLVLYMSIGSIWALLHFPAAIIIHLFLSLLISIPVSMYAIIKTRSMFPLLTAWFCYDVFLILWL